MSDEDYYSIQSILAENHVRSLINRRGVPLILQKLTCSFTLKVNGLGYLEGGTDQDVSFVFKHINLRKLADLSARRKC